MEDWDDTCLDPRGVAHAHDMTKGHIYDPDGFCWCEPVLTSIDKNGDNKVWTHRELH